MACHYNMKTKRKNVIITETVFEPRLKSNNARKMKKSEAWWTLVNHIEYTGETLHCDKFVSKIHYADKILGTLSRFVVVFFSQEFHWQKTYLSMTHACFYDVCRLLFRFDKMMEKNCFNFRNLSTKTLRNWWNFVAHTNTVTSRKTISRTSHYGINSFHFLQMSSNCIFTLLHLFVWCG